MQLIERLKALYGRGDVPAPTPDTETPACKAGAQKELQPMNQLSLKSIVAVKPDGGISGVIHSLLARSTDGVITIAPGIAKRILEEANFEGQRKVNEARVAERVNDITHGRWQPRVCAITLAELPDGTLCLINGQHRCHAIARSATKVDNLVTIISAADLADVRRLYALFDTPESKRTDMEMLDGSGVASALGLKRKTAAALFKALVIIRNDMEPKSGVYLSEAKSRSGRLEDIGDWAAEAKQFERLIDDADAYLQKKLLGQGAMAFCLYVLRHQPKAGTAFIGEIANNDGLRKNDPRARLIADFQNRSLAAGSLRQSVQRMSVAWNAFYDNRDLHHIKCIDGAPIVIKGTPKGRAGAR